MMPILRTLLALATCLSHLHPCNGSPPMVGSMAKKYQDNSWLMLCEMYHPSAFIVDTSVHLSGCKLKCIMLTNSSDEKKEFFDKSIQHEHNLHNGMYCKQDHVCRDGNCVLEMSTSNDVLQSDTPRASSSAAKRGILVIDLLDAYVPKKDQISASDTFVKIELGLPEKDGQVNSVIKVATSHVIWDTSYPTFNETFKIDKVSIMSMIFFTIHDKDIMNSSDFIAEVNTTIKDILETNQNHQTIKLPFLGDHYLRVTISWIAYE